MLVGLEAVAVTLVPCDREVVTVVKNQLITVEDWLGGASKHSALERIELHVGSNTYWSFSRSMICHR